MVPRPRKTFSCCCSYFWCISRLSPMQEISSKETLKRHTFSFKIRLQIDQYEFVWRSRNHRRFAQNFFTTGFHFLSPETNFLTWLIQVYVCHVCGHSEKTRGLTEPFIRHVRPNTSSNWDSESLILHTCKFDFRKADFLRIKYKMSDVISRYMARIY